jgi:hemoglobin
MSAKRGRVGSICTRARTASGRPDSCVNTVGSPPNLHTASKRPCSASSTLGVMTTDSRVEDQSLYACIGGAPAVAAAVEGLYDRILVDPELAPYFAGVGVEQLKTHQRAFIAAALGGPERHVGRSMVDAHRHLQITDTAFARVVDHLAATLSELGLSDATITAIAAALAPLKPDIVSAT